MGKLEWIIGISIVAVIVIVYAMVIYYRPCVQADTFIQKAGEKNKTVRIEEFFNVKKDYVMNLGITTNGLLSTLYSRKTDVLRKYLTISPSSGWTGSVYIVECPGIGPNDSLIINTHFLPKQWKQRKVYIYDLLRKVWIEPLFINENHPDITNATVMHLPDGKAYKDNATILNFRRNDMVHVAVFTK
jgi:hypothetical protein